MQEVEIFKSHIEGEKLFFNERMKNHTTFKIGGPVDVLITPTTLKEISEIIDICKKESIPLFFFGNGSNLLISDKGIKGVAIKLSENFSKVKLISQNEIMAEAGISLASLSNFALSNNLTGLEFASGIPGALGGAIYMNAGAYDGEIKDIIKEVSLMNMSGEIINLSNNEMEFSYRKSIVQREKYIILNTTIKLERGNKDKIESKMLELNKRRKEKQPVEMPSAGSTFKRPEGFFTGKLISDAGLSGFSIGGAQISKKHCGFIVNQGDAKSEDVVNLIRYVIEHVNDKFGVTLEPEIRVIGGE